MLDRKFDVIFQEENSSFEALFCEIEPFEVIMDTSGTIIVPTYTGSYEVTPLPFTETILETQGFLLEDNVVVLEIPYYETANESGGNTVIIG